MHSGWAAVAEVDWSRLFHAYGVASDTPAHLRALTGDDEDAREEALDHLWSAVIHQGTPWSVTPPAALVVAGLLADLGSAEPASDSISAAAGFQAKPLRGSMLRFLAAVAEAAEPDTAEEEIRAVAYPEDREDEIDTALEAILAGDEGAWGDESIDAIMARVVLDIRAIAPVLLGSAIACLDDPDLRVRADAVGAVGALALVPGAIASTDDLVVRLEQAADQAKDHNERCAIVLTLGEVGATPRAFLTDPHPAVRACAALAPTLADDDAATQEILTALRNPTEADSWLDDHPRQLSGFLRFALVAAAVQRAKSFDELLPSALAIASMTSHWTVESDWGPLLAAAFPVPVGEPPILTDAQRIYLQALVANDKVWDPVMGNPVPWFQRIGLSYDRDSCRNLLSIA
ncbi:hypothetical protein GCM10009555_025460 [Acrocarpospora macrocephala]|uniref:PBS lyase n=1 Tax=Acrocarpospora macrocephala TaxID=150177 RepID=A0A5M3WN42_9ACTN|nr:hypothetical protein [Acrocarpospora macrocephala]GES10324.1 hypothetical protein Amac_039210 [Acrocarpospora macrocephala]